MWLALRRCLDDGVSVGELHRSLARLACVLRDPARLRSLTSDADTAGAECADCGRVQSHEDVLCGRCGSPLEPSPVPRRIPGRLEIERRIGKGATGLVYRGVDVALGRRVAIKTLVGASPAAIVRLRREAQALAAVSHRHLVAVYGFEVFRGRPLILMEWVDGGTLVERKPLALAPAIDAMIAAADGLACLHAAGLVHRDVKPKNIGFTRSGELRLLDLGLARASSDDGSRGSSELAGTLVYMSPEALARDAPGPSFDVWSLDVVFYELLTRIRPFSGNDARSLIDAVRRAAWEPLGARLTSPPLALRSYFADAFDPTGARRAADGTELRERLLVLRRRLEEEARR